MIKNDKEICYIVSQTKTLRNTNNMVHRDFYHEIRGKKSKLDQVRAVKERSTRRRKMPLVQTTSSPKAAGLPRKAAS